MKKDKVVWVGVELMSGELREGFEEEMEGGEVC